MAGSPRPSLSTTRAGTGETAIAVRHIGSTAVPGLAAKPVIDVDVLVPDVLDEGRYLGRLEAAGFRLTFRAPIAGDEHRQLTYAAPNTNLHVFSDGALEPDRQAVRAPSVER